MKKTISMLLITIWMFLVALSALFTFKKEKTVDVESVIVLELWQIDMFEGGQGSRRQYLSQIASDFEKENKKVLINIVNKTVEGALWNFTNNVYPDMISFSPGLDGVLPILTKLDVKEGVLGGKINGDVYAYPWAVGGYVYIAREKSEKIQTVYISEGLYNLPTLAAYLEGLSFENQVKREPTDAFSLFLKDENSALLGTHRDLYRLSDKNYDVNITPLKKFSDLIQYIGVVKGDEKRIALSKRFVDFLVKNCKDSIYKIGMTLNGNIEKSVDNRPIAPLYGVKYDFTTSAFCQNSTIKEIKTLLNDENAEDDKKMKYLKNAIIYLK